MIVSFSLIGLLIGGLALTPGYASIGMAAPVLAVLFRLLQGFRVRTDDQYCSPTAILTMEPPHGRIVAWRGIPLRSV